MNQTDGVTWFLEHLQSPYYLTAFDSAIHMAEEISDPSRNVLKAIFLTISGAVSSFVFLVIGAPLPSRLNKYRGTSIRPTINLPH